MWTVCDVQGGIKLMQWQKSYKKCPLKKFEKVLVRNEYLCQHLGLSKYVGSYLAKEVNNKLKGTFIYTGMNWKKGKWIL